MEFRLSHLLLYRFIVEVILQPNFESHLRTVNNAAQGLSVGGGRAGVALCGRGAKP
jgi:hypothetical protein